MRRPEANEKEHAVLDARARALAQPFADEPAGQSRREHVVVEVGRERVAVPAARTRQVLPPGHLARLPGDGTALVGVRATSEGLVVVADLAALLDVDPASERLDRWLLVLDGAMAPLGLLVDGVDGLIQASELERSAGSSHQWVARALVVGVADDGVLVLDVDAVLADPRTWRSEKPSTPQHPTDEGGT